MSRDKGLLGLRDSLCFECGPGLACFTTCCADVTIFLTPFDVLRLTERLKMDSTLFLKEYTETLRGRAALLPLVVLKMGQEEGRPCRLVSSAGCRVYESRPWACRMFPLDQVGREDWAVVSQTDFCQGLRSKKVQSIKDYLISQGVIDSAEMDARYQEITDHPGIKELDVDNPKVARMIHLACYDLDRFREFVFESSFLKKFEVEEVRLAAVWESRIELLKFGFDWVKFGLFAEKTLRLKAGLEERDAGA